MTDIEPLLVAYVDGELDAASVAEVERILAENAEARQSVEIYRQTAVLLRAACAESVYATGTPPLAAPRPPSPVARWRRPLAVAAAIVLLLVGYGVGRIRATDAADDGFIDDVAEYHEIYSRETTHLAEVPASQFEEISRWLGERLHRPVIAPDLRTEGLRFAGARLWVSDGNPVADLLYTRADGPPVAFCIVHADDGPKGNDIEVTTRGEQRVAYWQSHGYTFAIVGDLSADRARAIAEQARRQGET
jgi:anti-sigma factor RsiW